MKNSNIAFPNYFKDNNKFESVNISTKAFVKYSHTNNEIQDVLLTIHQPFILCVKQGTVNLSSKGKTWSIKSNEVAIINRGNYIMSEDLSQSSNFDALLFFINQYFISHLKEKKNPIMKLLNSKIDVVPIQINSYVKNFVKTFFLLFEDKSPLLNENDFLDIKSKEFLFYLEKNIINKSDYIDTSVSDENEKLKQIIENKWEQHTLKELAFLCCMSESKFKRKFYQLYKKTPGLWVREKKLRKAKDVLTNSNIKIYILASDLGFRDSKYFSRLFKSLYGVSPIEYREQLTRI